MQRVHVPRLQRDTGASRRAAMQDGRHRSLDEGKATLRFRQDGHCCDLARRPGVSHIRQVAVIRWPGVPAGPHRPTRWPQGGSGCRVECGRMIKLRGAGPSRGLLGPAGPRRPSDTPSDYPSDVPAGRRGPTAGHGGGAARPAVDCRPPSRVCRSAVRSSATTRARAAGSSTCSGRPWARRDSATRRGMWVSP